MDFVIPASVRKKATLQNLPSLGRNNLATGYSKGSNGGSKPYQEATGSYDAKLVEMINTAIVDRSPAVKWDDVAGLDKAKQTLLEMVGEAEKLVRTLFMVAVSRQPSVIFMDEVSYFPHCFCYRC
ncbi:uncharacterized protein A4U43_C04F6920 [Asparagus officinalis]|uniref:ATPase AAA-type core domain-containing protein n=1 Tax=Asparagus officinalis TaxID=4686 RepID=A0A5P1F1J9_ASPOF|nr:uncharacterized protein A4U43_C04F6920 [Asparagus officinalis]